MVGQVSAAAAVTGGSFSPSPPGNQEWVNAGPNVSSLRPDVPNRRAALVNVARAQIWANQFGSIETSSTIFVVTPSFRSLSRSQMCSPSIRSIAGAPSRVASFCASGV